MVVSIFFFGTMKNLFMKLNYKDLLTSVKVHVAGSAIIFSGLSYKITFFIGCYRTK